jgi:hypothetical protein
MLQAHGALLQAHGAPCACDRIMVKIHYHDRMTTQGQVSNLPAQPVSFRPITPYNRQKSFETMPHASHFR